MKADILVAKSLHTNHHRIYNYKQNTYTYTYNKILEPYNYKSYYSLTLHWYIYGTFMLVAGVSVVWIFICSAIYYLLQLNAS